MKRINIILIFVAAIFFTACGSTATANKSAAVNTNTSNSNTTAKPVTAASTKEDLIANEKKAWASWKTKDGKYFEDYLTDNAIGMGSKGRSDKAAIVKRISDPTCEVNDFSLTEEQMAPLGADAALLTYKATQDVKCGGKAFPATVRAATILARSGDKWKAVYHNEVAVIDPKAAPAKAAVKNESPKKPEVESPAKPAISDANTDAMLTVEKAVWEAWKDHDGKKIEELTAKEISFINIFGTYFATKADALKDWTSTGCQVKSVSVTDAVATVISPTVGILTFKGGADGTCFGQKVPPIWGTSIYVKDGDAWKWTFGMNISAG